MPSDLQLGQAVTFHGTLSSEGLQSLITAIVRHHEEVVVPLEREAGLRPPKALKTPVLDAPSPPAPAKKDTDKSKGTDDATR